MDAEDIFYRRPGYCGGDLHDMCRHAPVNIPPGLIQNPPTDIMRNYTEDDEYPEEF